MLLTLHGSIWDWIIPHLGPRITGQHRSRAPEPRHRPASIARNCIRHVSHASLRTIAAWSWTVPADMEEIVEPGPKAVRPSWRDPWNISLDHRPSGIDGTDHIQERGSSG